MKNVKSITIQMQSGEMYQIISTIDINKVLAVIPKDIMYVCSDNLTTIQNKYFAMLTELAKYNGDTKTSLHEILKPILFGKFIDFPHYFKDGKYKQSTTALTYEGWQALIAELKTISLDIFNHAF